MKRRALREQIFKLLFRVEFFPPEEIAMQAQLFFDSGDQTISEEDRVHILEKTQAVIAEIPRIDEELDACMEGWTMKRIGRIEKTILRLAVYEIVHDEEIPEKVAISEAVELSKKFGQESAPSFVNGVLAKYVKGRSTIA
ncbi:MAG: transcription antitermination factor NusB [Lachnospiraceae bacterium]|nr:transcription antitermination factor NusB [Lachnospiraceae bacterium]